MSTEVTTQNSILARGLTKRFGSLKAVDSLDLETRPGEIFGLLGPNAAGKTTTIRMLAGIIRFDEGEGSVLGLDLLTDLERIKRRIGYVAQAFGLYPDLTVQQNLEFYTRLYGFPARSDELIEQYGLDRFRKALSGTLSGGYKRRLSLVCALGHDPDVVFLDEPTAGIDPVTRKELWDIFYDLAAAGKTLFVTTHYMEEAERCNALAFLSRGRLVAKGSPAQLREQLFSFNVWSLDLPHDPAVNQHLSEVPGVVSLNRFGDTLRVVAEKECDTDRITDVVREQTGKSVSLTSAAPNLEDAFMTLTRSSGR